MQFNSLTFLLFAPAAILASYAVPRKLRSSMILLASILFYLSFGIPAVFVVAGLWLLTVISAALISRTHSKAILSGSVLLIVALLVSFRFMNPAENTWFGQTIPFSLFMPIGLSFFSLNAIGYLCDLYQGKLEQPMSLITTALFLVFFPTVTSGPILRAKAFSSQIGKDIPLRYSRIQKGFVWILWGFFWKLVIAERCALLVNTVYAEPSYAGFPVVLAIVAYSLQIYADFAGYSLIARGLSWCLGFEIPDNFKQPYFSESIKEFWRRWHISLSTWLRDYVYIPLGGSRCTKLRKYCNLMITFLVSGFWHGKGFTFVIWGGLHGLYQILEDLISGLKPKQSDSDTRVLHILLTFVLVSIAWVFFRSDGVSEALHILKQAVQLKWWGTLFSDTLYTYGLDTRNFWILIICLFAGALVDWHEYHNESMLDWYLDQHIVLRVLIVWVIVFLITISLNISAAEFIYMQF